MNFSKKHFERLQPKPHYILLLSGMIFLCGNLGFGQRKMEYLKRGIVATPTENGIFISWRLLGTEPQNTEFNLYRMTNGKTEKLNQKPLTKGTNYLDQSAQKNSSNTYFVKAIENGKELPEDDQFIYQPDQKPYLSIPLKTPKGYSPNDISIADLDGDGEYEIVLHQTGKSHDNSHAGMTDPPVFQAYKLDGTFLWEINLGTNIREGAHYTQFMVYDLDGDGKAEIVMKTADGSKDSKGKIIGDPSKDWRNNDGYILGGEEFLTVFDGETGMEIHTVKYLVPRHPDTIEPSFDQLKALWGDGKGNRVDRFLAGVAYLDGKNPSVIMSRGYYTRTAIAAWDFKDRKLQLRWLFDSDSSEENKLYGGQGNHNLSIADVDEDGKDEIIFGAMTVDNDGTILNSTGFGHGDALHVSDLDPDIPGLEIFDIQERFDDAGAHLRSGASGKVLWKLPSLEYSKDNKFQGPGRGICLNVDPRYDGFECWIGGAGIRGMYNIKGEKISEKSPAANMGIYWDGDLLREILDGTYVGKWDYENEKLIRLFDAKDFNCASNNGTKKNPGIVADLYGDWREELIYRTEDNQELRVFTTTIPTEHRIYTLMQNPQYRLSIAWQNVGYNQPPHPDFYIDESVENYPPPQNIYTEKPEKIKD